MPYILKSEGTRGANARGRFFVRRILPVMGDTGMRTTPLEDRATRYATVEDARTAMVLFDLPAWDWTPILAPESRPSASECPAVLNVNAPEPAQAVPADVCDDDLRFGAARG